MALQFFSDARESETYLRNLQDSIRRKYSCDHSTSLTRLEDLLQDSMVGSGSPRHPCGVWRCGQGGFGLWVNLSLDGRAEGLNLCVCGGWQLLCHSFLPNELKLYFFQSCSRGQAQVVYLIISSFFFSFSH